MKRLVLLCGLLPTPLFALTGEVSFDLDANLPKMDATGKCPVNGGEIVNGKLSGKFTVHLKECKTGNGIRDDHMYEVIETKTFPTADLVLSEVPTGGTKPFKATLTFHGKSVPVEGKITFFTNQTAKASFLIDYTHFDIKEVNKLGATVSKMVPISVTLKL